MPFKKSSFQGSNVFYVVSNMLDPMLESYHTFQRHKNVRGDTGFPLTARGAATARSSLPSRMTSRRLQKSWAGLTVIVIIVIVEIVIIVIIIIIVVMIIITIVIIIMIIVVVVIIIMIIMLIIVSPGRCCAAYGRSPY